MAETERNLAVDEHRGEERQPQQRDDPPSRLGASFGKVAREKATLGSLSFLLDPGFIVASKMADFKQYWCIQI